MLVLLGKCSKTSTCRASDSLMNAEQVEYGERLWCDVSMGQRQRVNMLEDVVSEPCASDSQYEDV